MSDTNPLMIWEQNVSSIPAPTIDPAAWSNTISPSQDPVTWWASVNTSTPAAQTPDSIASKAERIMQEMNNPNSSTPANNSTVPNSDDLMPAVKEALKKMGINLDPVPSNNNQNKPSDDTNMEVVKMLEAKTTEVEQYKLVEAQRQQELAKAAEDKKVLWGYIERLIAENNGLKNWNQFADDTQKTFNELYWSYISNPSDQAVLWNFVKTISEFIDKQTGWQLNIAKIVLQQLEATKWWSSVPSQNNSNTNQEETKSLQTQQEMGMFIPII